MKKITVNGIEYYYQVYREHGWSYTEFYEGKDNHIPKYKHLNILFGNKTVNRPKSLFTMGGSIENPSLSKQQVLEMIQPRVDELNLFNARKEEIEKGEIL